MTDTASAAPSEREKFEAWAQSLGLAHESNDPSAMWTWAAWQAALRAQPTPPAVVEPLAAETIMKIVMDVEQQHHFLRGTTYWAVAVGRATEAAHGIGIKKGDCNG